MQVAIHSSKLGYCFPSFLLSCLCWIFSITTADGDFVLKWRGMWDLGALKLPFPVATWEVQYGDLSLPEDSGDAGGRFKRMLLIVLPLP